MARLEIQGMAQWLLSAVRLLDAGMARPVQSSTALIFSYGSARSSRDRGNRPT